MTLKHYALLPYWYVRYIFKEKFLRPTHSGAKGILRNEHGEILFVLHTYGRKDWSLPGGGAKTGESMQQTMERELFEEIGHVPSNLQFIGIFHYVHRFGKDRVACFSGIIHSQTILSLDKKEIRDAKFEEMSLLSLGGLTKDILDFEMKSTLPRK